MSQMFKTPFGSAQRKLVAVRLADYADDDGRGIWPAVATIATECDLSERTVQRTLSDFVEEGILTLVAEGGGRKTSRYDFDLAMVQALKTGEKTRGDTVSPVTACHPCGDTVSPQGCHGVTQTFNEPSNNLSSGAQERGEREGENPDLEVVRQAHGDGEVGVEGKTAKQREALFWVAVKDWKDFAAMPKKPALAAWLKLSDAEMDEFIDRREAYFAELRRAKRDHWPAPSTCFAEKLWQHLPQAAPSSPAGESDVVWAPPFGPLWQARRMRELMAGARAMPPMTQMEAQSVASSAGAADFITARRLLKFGFPVVGAMHSEAGIGRDWRLSRDMAAALDGEAKAMEPVPVGSETFERWRLHHAAQGWPWLPDIGKQAVVYFPAKKPDGFFNSEVK